MHCAASLASDFEDAPEPLREFWKAPIGSRLAYLRTNRPGASNGMFYRLTKRDKNRIGLSSIDRPNDHTILTMREATRLVRDQVGYNTSEMVFLRPGEYL